MSRPPGSLGCPGWLLVLWALLWPSLAQADEPSPREAAEQELIERYRKLSRPPSGYGHLFTTLMFGEGVRFNNPYRLRTQLGETAESLSLTAPYVDTAVTMCFGPPDGLQHGGTAHLSVALAGVAQQVITIGYVLGYRGASPTLVYGRLGPAVIITPDANVGGELAGGFAYFLTGALGLSAELVGNLYYGAGTYVAQHTVYPIVSLQLGLIVDFEVLP